MKIKYFKLLRAYGDSNPSYRLRRPVGYPDYLIGPTILKIKNKIINLSKYVK